MDPFGLLPQDGLATLILPTRFQGEKSMFSPRFPSRLLFTFVTTLVLYAIACFA